MEEDMMTEKRLVGKMVSELFIVFLNMDSSELKI